jgi:hypothetical protein
MKHRKNSPAEDFQVGSRFQSLRKLLLAGQYAEHLQKPLAFWVLPADRRLPLAFLGRTLQDLLDTPYWELLATPGIGQKKMRTFIKLLSRVANTDPSELPGELEPPPPEAGSAAEGTGVSPNGFDPSTVSEVVWAQWRATVVGRGLGDEALGRLAPTLKNMTRVIWNTPLKDYARLTLAEIRAMRTHGEKRVRAILEVFHSVHTLLGNMGRQDHLVLRITPRLIDAVETWTCRGLQTPGVPGTEEIFEQFISPLLEQIRIDAAEQIVRLAQKRLGLDGPIPSVRQTARSMGLTRARVYQLLNEINDIMIVRWPLGRHQVHQLRQKLRGETSRMDDPPDLGQFHAAIELFYPTSRRGADGPLDPPAQAGADDRAGLAQPVGQD